jgi:hypothetical protein
MTPQELLDTFAIKIYEPPLASLRDSGAITDLSSPISVAMLLVDFDTEVAINGITDFIGNSSGRYINETISALRKISCGAEAEVLAKIEAITSAVGMTHQAIQAERSGLAEYSITSFSQLHGDKWRAVSTQVHELCSSINFAHVTERVLQFVAANKIAFENALRK